MTKHELAQTSDTLPATAGDPYTELMSAAISQGEAGVAALERLVALQERREAQQAERAYNAALARFQADCPPIRKGRRGAHNATYADLDDIMAAIGPVLAANGLSVGYDSEELEGGRMRVTCIVRHADGHSERSHFVVSREKPSNRMNDTQRDGSASTYGRRYALGLALGITTGERDDDAQGMHPPTDTVTEEQAATLQALAEEVGMDVEATRKFLSLAGVDTWAGFPAAHYKAAVGRLERKRKEAAA